MHTKNAKTKTATKTSIGGFWNLLILFLLVSIPCAFPEGACVLICTITICSTYENNSEDIGETFRKNFMTDKEYRS